VPALFSAITRFLWLCIVAALAACGYLAWYAFTPVALAGLPIEFEIAPGSRLRSAAAQMEASGVAVGRLRFELLGRLLGRARDIKAGSYELATAASPLELLDKLTNGDVTQAELVFAEGWNIRQLRAALDAQPSLRHDSAALSDAELMARLGAPDRHPEGQFFPDTYLFSKGASDLAVLQRAFRAMQRHLDREWAARDSALPYQSAADALTMASIIEKETGRADERSHDAGALVNRLRIGMRLQVDPIVIYGLGTRFDGNLRKADLLEDGPYNSYLRAGLPPTPISMPGLAALRAALHPAKTDALYYVARGDGSSQFSRNLGEHNRAVNRYQLQKRPAK
jgi:UPF0755 protein